MNYFGSLPAIVSECAVGLGHLMGIYLLFDRVAFALSGGDKFGGEFACETVVASRAGELENPSEREGNLAFFGDLDWHLICCTAYTAGFHGELGFDIFEGFLENIDSALFGAFFDYFQSIVNEGLGCGFLAALHHAVDEFRDYFRVILIIGLNLPLFRTSAPWHLTSKLVHR